MGLQRVGHDWVTEHTQTGEPFDRLVYASQQQREGLCVLNIHIETSDNTAPWPKVQQSLPQRINFIVQIIFTYIQKSKQIFLLYEIISRETLNAHLSTCDYIFWWQINFLGKNAGGRWKELFSASCCQSSPNPEKMMGSALCGPLSSDVGGPVKNKAANTSGVHRQSGPLTPAALTGLCWQTATPQHYSCLWSRWHLLHKALLTVLFSDLQLSSSGSEKHQRPYCSGKSGALSSTWGDYLQGSDEKRQIF